MIPLDLALRAKAGDRAAVNEVLRLSLPAIRWHVGRALRTVHTSFDVFEDAVAEGVEQAWKAIEKWDPTRGDLATLIRPGTREGARRLAGALGHAVDLPSYHGAEKTRYAADRAHGARFVRSMEAPVSAESEEPRSETMPGVHADPEAQHDVARILAGLSERQADILRAHAEGDTNVEIGAALGFSGEYVKTLMRQAICSARDVANGLVAPHLRVVECTCGRDSKPGKRCCEACLAKATKSRLARAAIAAEKEAA